MEFVIKYLYVYMKYLGSNLSIKYIEQFSIKNKIYKYVK